MSDPMLFTETRGNDGHHAKSVSFSDAILNPIASFGGLYSPASLPSLTMEFLAGQAESTYQQLTKKLLQLFDVDIPEQEIDQALALYQRFDDPNNPVPVVRVYNDLYVSELYHGPTRAFKDMALQPFGSVLSALARQRGEHYLILAATSGDTGPAALDTFRNKDNVRVVCLYPDGGTSDVQRLQMVTEDAANLKVLGIHGNFDDAQKALKTLLGSSRFKDALKAKGISLSAANSVNFGRIIFQIMYHVHSYLELIRQGAITLGDKVYMNVPSGNFGNALGAFYARQMGLPIEKIFISSNDNNVLTDLIEHGLYDLTRRKLINTTSPAMDILVSSNVERILYALFGADRTRELMQQLNDESAYQLSDGEKTELRGIFAADYCSDEQGKAYIRAAFDHGYLMDPHTATCFKTHETRRDKPLVSIIYSTAEWTKFSPVIADALTGECGKHDIDALQSIADTAGIPIPTMIRDLFDKPIRQGSVINKEDIESEIIAFLTG